MLLDDVQPLLLTCTQNEYRNLRDDNIENTRSRLASIGLCADLIALVAINICFVTFGALLYSALRRLGSTVSRMQRYIATIGTVFFVALMLRSVYAPQHTPCSVEFSGVQRLFCALCCFVSTHDSHSYTGFRAATLAFSAGRGFPGVPIVNTDNGCILSKLSPCSPCFSRSFHLSVWIAYEPFFQFLLGALYGPFPLLIVTFDIYRGILIKRQGQILVIRPVRQPSSMANLMSSALFEYYSNFVQESDSS